MQFGTYSDVYVDVRARTKSERANPTSELFRLGSSHHTRKVQMNYFTRHQQHLSSRSRKFYKLLYSRILILETPGAPFTNMDY